MRIYLLVCDENWFIGMWWEVMYLYVLSWWDFGWKMKEWMWKGGGWNSARLIVGFRELFAPILVTWEICGSVTNLGFVCACKVFDEISKKVHIYEYVRLLLCYGNVVGREY